MKPLIGITPSPSIDALPHGDFLRYAMASTYVDAVLAAGGVPVVLPPQAGHAGPLLDALDGLLLSGGGDVEPARYGATEVDPTTYGVHPARDRFETELVETALARDVPLLGICRGLQMLNVALGGSLIQDIATVHAADHAAVRVEHRQQSTGLAPDDIGHEVVLESDSPLARRFAGRTVGVNSFHHQAIASLAPRLVPVAFAPDGVIEAVVVPGRDVVAVQWHPESMVERHPEHLEPFRLLIEAARARRVATALV